MTERSDHERNGGVTTRELSIMLAEQDKRTDLKFKSVAQEFSSLAKAVELQREEYRQQKLSSGEVLTRIIALGGLLAALAVGILSLFH